ncbi:MAG TPA: hypothetical protein VL484_09175 [Vicinamibacterales bacterium]|jgi:hypothetical protein|nr:hypothetical protein [Vicinamibacterales bacterium]
MGTPDGTVEIDDGTLARIESPVPGPIGLDAPSGSGTHSQPAMSTRILGYARRQSGTRVGDGQCFALADRALTSAGAKTASDFGTITRDADYVWGTSVALSDLQPGDVIQFRGYVFDRETTTEHPDGSTDTRTEKQGRSHHTAVVESVGSHGDAMVLEQNSPDGSAVHRSHLYFTTTTFTEGGSTTTVTVQGTVWFYRPQPR